MMPEGKEAPTVRLRKTLAIFNGDINPVVRTIEISAPGWFLAGAVGKRRIKNSSQLFYNDRSFGKLTRLQVRINVLLLNVDMMIFGKVRLPIVETIGSQRSTNKHPSAKSLRVREFQFAVRIKHGARLFRLGSHNRFRDQ